MMDHNPYSPPQTEVLESPPPNDIGPRPKEVTLAVRLFWAELAIGAVQLALRMASKDSNPYFIATLITIVVFFAAEAFVVYSLWMRRNWARYVALAATLLGLLELAQAILHGGLETGPREMAFSAGELALDGIALFLLFTRPAKEWFRKRAAS